MINNFKIGTDPEVFVRDKQTKEIQSAIGFIPGTKEFPFPIGDAGHAIQTDNVMAEFCVPPATNAEQLTKDINICINTINEILPETMETIIDASAILNDKYLNNEQAQTFGCDPDFNAYSLTQNDAPESNTNLRTAGGHIHISYDEPNFEDNIKIIKAFDLFLGLPSLDLDKDTERRKMYGKAGAFRIKNYGIEYRALSNFWIKSPESINWAVQQINNAIEFINKGEEISDEDQLNIQLAINNQDIMLAGRIAMKYNILFTFDVVKLLV